MIKIKFFVTVISMCSLGFAQPYNYIQPINPADTGLVSSPNRRVWDMLRSPEAITIDGEIDEAWSKIESKKFDRYIMCRTKYENEIYSCAPDAKPNRTPSSTEDFSGSFKITYDEDYLYLLYNVTDNEINDGFLNPGIQEHLEIVEAPYPDSAQQLLKGNPYPPYLGSAPELNKKFCYWHYLGAFKINFFLKENGEVSIRMDERSDAALKINYEQRASACQAAWKVKSDGTSGYYLEAAISLKQTMADSANNPYTLPQKGETKYIAFDMFMFDLDFGQAQVKASWNAEDDCVWDNMLYTGKLRILEWTINNENNIQKTITFAPNPVKDKILLNMMVERIDIYSITGTILLSKNNSNEINLESLSPGIYVLMTNGMVCGKFIKID